MTRNKKWQWFWTIMGYVVSIAPAGVYALCNLDAFKMVEGVNIGFSGMLAALTICMCVLNKIGTDNKRKWGTGNGSFYMVLIGALLFLLGDMITQIGMCLLLVGVGALVDTFVCYRLRVVYGERVKGE